MADKNQKVSLIGQICFDKGLLNPRERDDGSQQSPNLLIRIPKNIETHGFKQDLTTAWNTIRQLCAEVYKTKGITVNIPPYSANNHPLFGLPQSFKTGIRDGDLAVDQKLFESLKGHWYFSVSFNSLPMVCDAQLNPMDVKQLYAGAWIRLNVRFGVFNKPNSHGLTLWANNVQFLRHDTPLGPPPIAPEDEFDRVEDLGAAPTADFGGLV